MTKNVNYIELENACNYLWVTTTEIRIILGGCSKSKADTFRKRLEEKLKAEKVEALSISDEKERLKALARCFYYDDTHPHRLPIRRVLEDAHIDLDFVRREANKMRKAFVIERKELNTNENAFESKMGYDIESNNGMFTSNSSSINCNICA